MSLRRLSTFAVLLLTLAARCVTAAEPLPAAAQWVPAEAVAVVEVGQPKAILDWLLDPRLTTAVTTNPLYQKATAGNPGFQQFLNTVDYVAGRLGTDWQTAVRKLTGGGVLLAVGPKNETLLIVDSQDAAMLDKLHEMILGFRQSSPDAVATDYQGVKVYALGSGEAHALVDGRLIVSNRAAFLHRALDLRSKTEGSSLASTTYYSAARQALGTRALSAVVNLAAVKKAPRFEKALENYRNNPLNTLLFAGLIDAAKRSDWLALGLQADGEGLSLRTVASGQPDTAGLMGFSVPGGDRGILTNVAVPRQLAGLSLYRDLHQFYATKDKLFPERTSGLIFFENMMGIFFSGRDLTEEVLAEAQPEMRFVAAQQQYEAGASPPVQLPGFAAIFKVKNPEKFGEVMEEAWQKMLGLVNFTRGQKALPGLIIDRPTHADVRYSMAYFSKGAADDADHLGLRYNYRPSLVRMDDYLILSTAQGLAEDLIDAVKKEKSGSARPLAGVNGLLEIDGPQALSALEANRTVLVHNNMLEKGNSQEKAEAEIGVFLMLLKRLGKVRVEMATRDGHTQADVDVKLNLAQ